MYIQYNLAIQSTLLHGLQYVPGSITAVHFKLFPSLPKGRAVSLQSPIPLPVQPPQPLAAANPLSVSTDLLILGISYKWNHTYVVLGG